MFKNVHRWTVVRSGPALTITGQDDNGAPIKITGVKSIAASALYPIAVDDAGGAYRLLPESHDLIRRAIAAQAGSPSELMGFMGADDGEDRCTACDVAFIEGDLVHNEAQGGLIHAACCGPERESYYKGDGEPLEPGDPIPTPFAYRRDPVAAVEAA